MGVERVPNTYFDTPERFAAFQRWLKRQEEKPKGGGTVGCVCLDTHGNLAAATSTGGMTGKMFGRVGDSPIIGAGTYADNRTCAVSCTGTGEEFIRHSVARTIAGLMAYRGLSVQQAGDELIHKTLKPGDGGCIILSKTGDVAMPFSTDGMFRGRADSTGRLEVAIWADKAPAAGWKDLFDGKTLDGWKAAEFGDAGKVAVKDGAIHMPKGAYMTGVTYTRGDFPTADYEVSLEAARLDGDDFFCTTTFPVGAESCSLVVGGWGGTTVGLSTINRLDASMNETTTTKEFDRGKWYAVRLRVTKDRVRAWIDGDRVVDLPTEDKTLAIRRECGPCQPFGVATWKTAGAVRNVRVRPLTAAEVQAAKAGADDE
jgi:hypothetical protein